MAGEDEYLGEIVLDAIDPLAGSANLRLTMRPAYRGRGYGTEAILLVLGLFTRPVAFILSGQMAVAYFMAHAPHSFFPAINKGEGAILFCFVFLYLVAAGAGPWSVDAARRSNA